MRGAGADASLPDVMIFAVLVLAYVLSQFYRAFLAVVAGDLSADLGLDAAMLGALSAVWFAAFALAQIPVGFALDRLGPRRTIALPLLLAVAGAVLLATASGYAQALAAMALIGLGCSSVLMGGLYLFARAADAHRFAARAAALLGLGNLGNLLSATPLALATEAIGWRASLGTIAGITLLAALLVALVVRDPPPVAPDEARGSGGFLGGLRRILAIRGLWPVLPLVAVGYAVVIAERSLWIAPFFRDVHGFSLAQTGNAALLMAAAMAAGAFAYAPLERLVGEAKRTALLGSLVTAASFLALGAFGHTSAALALGLVAIAGFAGLTYGVLMEHARLFFPPDLIGRGVTFLNLVFIGGAGILQWLSGRVVREGLAAAGPEPTFAALHLGFGALLLGACLVYGIAPSRPKAPGAATLR